MIFNKAFDEIDYSDIQKLKDDGIAERQNLEYKAQMWGSNGDDKKEMLCDISSIANAFGGFIVLGVKADQDGVPVEITEIPDAERERDRILSSCISAIEPRIPGFKIKTIISPEQKSLIVIFIPRSIRAPHMVTFKGKNQFWIRHDRQKSPMSIEEIREACLRVESIQKSIQEFIKETKEEILHVIGDETYYVIGSVPLSIKSEVVDTNDRNIRDFLQNPPNQRNGGFNLNFLDSFNQSQLVVPTLRGVKIGEMSHKKVELIRNGYYELTKRFAGEFHLIKIYQKEQCVIQHLPLIEITVSYFRALKVLKELLGIEETYLSFASIFNIRKHGFAKFIKDGYSPFPDRVSFYNKDHLEIDPMAIPDFQDPDKVALEFLGRIWNAFGFESDSIPYFINGKFNWEKYVKEG